MPDDTVLLERHFDTAFAAPDGIQKLRELILTLAMQGKLVPQDPKDEPVSELLKAIEAEKQRLVKEGKIKQPKPFSEIKSEELPYKLPDTWQWVRVRNICHDWGQKIPDKLFTYIDVGSIDNKRGIISNDVQLLESFDAPSRARKIVQQGTVIYSTVRPYLLNIAIVDKEFSHEPIASTAFAILHPFCKISNRFIYYYLRSPVFISYVESTMKGVAYPAINDGDFFQGTFPLPPLTEQHRIVAKIDRLMARCDELEKLRAERNHKRITIHTAALDRLLTAKESSDFSTAWRFITQYFGELYSVKENVAELRKAILQLAVMGKLVPQDPTDEPASELLKAIEAEKQRLAQTEEIKISKPLLEIKIDEIPYELPKGWKWVRLGSIAAYIQRGIGPRYSDIPEIPVISQKCIQWSGFNKSIVKFIDPSTIDRYRNERFIRDGDLLWNSTGTGTIGRINVYRDELNEFKRVVADSHVTVIRLIGLCNAYVLNFLMSPIVQKHIEENASGTTNQIELNTTTVINQVVPLPPLAEQRRIVAKIDQLMTLCDQLDQQIDAATSKQTTLLNAVMAQV